MVAIFADSNRARMRYIKSVDGWGTTPATGRTRELRYTGSSVTASKETTVSEEIRADRMVSDIIETSAKSAGEINIEFSAGSHDDFLESFMMGAWTRPMTFDSAQGKSLVFADADTIYIKGKDVTDYFFAGRRIRTNGFVNPANNNYWQIDTIVFNAGANRTEITLTTATAVAENGTANTFMYDANDVIVLKNTNIRAGTGGLPTFDSNGTNAFAAAIAAGQIVPGQKVFVDGLGFATGTVTLTGQPAAGSRVRLSDGKKAVTFQFGGVFGQTVEPVDLGTDFNQTAENLALALNEARAVGKIAASATFAGGVVTIKLQTETGTLTEVSDTGNVIAVANFSGGDSTLHGIYTILSATDDVLEVSPAPNTNANAGARPITIKGSMLRNPHLVEDITPQDYVLETGFEDVGQYFIADGQRVGGFSYDISSNAILTGSFTFSGRAMTRSDVTILGDEGVYTVLGTTATEVANSTVNVGNVNVNGEVLSTALQSIQLTGDNNLRDQNAVSYKFPAGIGSGRMDITGSVNAYFADGALWDKFLNHETVSLSYSISDVAGHTYHFTIPSCKFSSDQVNPAGGNQDVMEAMEFTAKRDPETECQIQIDRFSSNLPITA
ncbi:minor tail protein [Caulobacter phage CcrSC]|uniref:Major tail tube protein n=1 Tax=Caulobacter phage CcrSC TaxID=2283272 RepID=A0A385EDJ8_9CAUD|nr:minor tail protein [Caulobacter phage CcrSC]AXQ69740.1 major tail tube protein [Caulobacter phage CcrSC]